MGYFTFTFANRKLRKNRYNDYHSSCKVPYDGKAYVICPDDTIIEEQCYQGYGIFGNQDIYELVVDWNRGHLLNILIQNGVLSATYQGIAELLDKHEDHLIPDFVHNQVIHDHAPAYLEKDWKRDLGIEISCGKTPLRYPIKIISTPRCRKKYDMLPPSVNCQ